MAKIERNKDALRKRTLTSFHDEYAEYSDNWRNLETKAQGNIAIAGIFIAGVFAFLTRSGGLFHDYEKLLLLIAVGFLVISIGFSMLVLRIRTAPVPPLGSFMDVTVTQLLLIESPDYEERVKRFYGDHLTSWRDVINKIDKTLRVKASNLWIAQYLLMFAIFCIAALAVLRTIMS